MRLSGYWESDGEYTDGVKILSCGHNYLTNGKKIDRPSGRDDFLIIYIAEEFEIFQIDGKEHKALKGSIILYAPFDPQYHYYSGRKTAENYYIHFKTDSFNPFENYGLITNKIYNGEVNSEFEDCFNMIINELQQKPFLYKKTTVTRLNLLLELIARRHTKSHRQADIPENIPMVIAEIERNYHENKTVDEYASMCNMSMFHFIRTFKKITGQTPIKYRNTIRINHAKQFLKNTSLPVGKISEKTGFLNSEYFSREFKRQTGVSPTNFKKL